jgi:hypothetical protein
MSNHLVAVSPAVPNTIPSGAATTLTVDYESDDSGAIQFSSGGGFTLSPAAVPAPITPSGSCRSRSRSRAGVRRRRTAY